PAARGDWDRSLSHLHRGPSDFFDVDSALDWTHPEDIFPLDSLQSLVCSPSRLVNSPSGSSSIAMKARWKIKNYCNVSVNLLLVSNDLRGLPPHMSVLKNLVCPGICCHSIFETEGPVNVLRQLTRSTPLQEVSIGHYRFDAGLAIEFRI